MRTKRSITWALVAAAAAFAAVAAMPGCELLVDFDRSKIPQDAAQIDGTTPEGDGTSSESSLAEDGEIGDGATDAPDEASTTDALPEAAVDAGVEAGAEGGTEAGVEAGTEAGATEAGPDGSADSAAAGDGASESGADGE
jgi:hypothetical protein